MAESLSLIIVKSAIDCGMAMAMTDNPEGFEPARFSLDFLDRAGPHYLKADGERIIVGMRVDQSHVNYIGIAHGGVLTTLADVALSIQLHRSETPPLNVATVSMNTNFLSGAKLDDWLEAKAAIDRKGGRTAYASGSIRSGDRMVMTMSGVLAIIRAKI